MRLVHTAVVNTFSNKKLFLFVFYFIFIEVYQEVGWVGVGSKSAHLLFVLY